MIIFLSDTDGDDVAIDADAIYAVTVGEVKPPGVRPAPQQGHGHEPEPDKHTVTLVHTLGGPLVVSQSFEAVVDAWQGARRAADALALLMPERMCSADLRAQLADRDQQIAALREGLALYADADSWSDFDGLIIWTPVDTLPWEEARALLAPPTAEGGAGEAE